MTSKVKVLVDESELVEVVMPAGGIAHITNGEFRVSVDGNVFFARKCLPKWTYNEVGKMKKIPKARGIYVDLFELAANPYMEASDVSFANKHHKFDVRRHLKEVGRFELSCAVKRKIGGLRDQGCERVFIAYRHGCVGEVIPADEKSCFGVCVYSQLAMVGQ